MGDAAFRAWMTCSTAREEISDLGGSGLYTQSCCLNRAHASQNQWEKSVDPFYESLTRQYNELVEQELENVPYEKKDMIAYELAGRRDPDHYFADFRSPKRARRRLYKEKEKYYGYRGVKRGQVGELHYKPESRAVWGYTTPLPEAETTTMTKTQLYREAQWYPRPPTRHRSDRWDRRTLPRSDHSKRFRGALNDSDYDKVRDWIFGPPNWRKPYNDICYCIPDVRMDFPFGNFPDDAIYDVKTRRLEWGDVEGQQRDKYWAPRPGMGNQQERKRAAWRALRDQEHHFMKHSRKSEDCLYLILANGREFFPYFNPKEWFMSWYDVYDEFDTKDGQWSWFQDYWHCGILVQGEETVELLRHFLAAFGRQIERYCTSILGELDAVCCDPADYDDDEYEGWSGHSSDDEASQLALSSQNEWEMLEAGTSRVCSDVGAFSDYSVIDNDCLSEHPDEEWEFVGP